MRSIYYIYRFFTQVGNWVGNRVRAAGIAAFIAVILSGAMSVGQPRNSLFQLFCLSSALVFLSALWFLFRRGKISVKTNSRDFAHIGEKIDYRIRVSSSSRRILRSIAVAPTDDDPVPPIHSFLSRTEPREAERNAFDRKLAFFRWKWLQREYRSNLANISPELFDLKPGEEKILRYQFLTNRRGVHDLSSVHFFLPDPLGLFQRCKTIRGNETFLQVLPQRYPIPTFDILGSASTEAQSESERPSTGSSGDFFSLRDYRHGDSIRQIDWKAWARTGKPVVREVEDITQRRFHVWLDCEVSPVSDEGFEAMLSVAASLSLPKNSHQLSPASVSLGGQIFTAETSYRLSNNTDFLRALASAKPAESTAAEAKLSSILQLFQSGEPVLLIPAHGHPENDKLLSELAKISDHFIPIFVSDSPSNVHHLICAKTIREDLASLSTQPSSV